MSLDIIKTILQVTLLIISIILTLFVLLHKGQGGGLSDMFGGGVTSNLNASGVAMRNLNRITVILGIIWIAVVIALGIIMRVQGS
ncbi:MAG: preprotein translocase subunit SecG [Micrococcaceae bacterium]